MAEDLSIKLEVGFEEYNKIEKKLKDRVSQLEKNVTANIKFDSSQINDLEKQLNKIKDTLGKYKLEIDVDKTQFDNVNKQANDLSKNIDNLQKKQVKIIDDNTVQVIEQVKKNLLETQKIIYDFKNNKLTEVNTSDYAKVQKDLYSQLNKLQNDEFNIKQKLISADQETSNELSRQLSLINEQKKSLGNNIVNYNLKNESEIEKLTNSRVKLQSDLNIKATQYNKTQEETTRELQKQIQLYKQSKEIDIQNLKTRYGDLVDDKSVNDFKNQLNNITPENFNTKELNNSFKQLEANIKSSKDALKLTQKEAESFGDSMSRNIAKFSQWYIIGNMISSLPRKFSEGITFAKEFNSTMNSISIVTGKLNLNGLSDEFYNLGDALSSTQKDISTGANEFFRQGLTQSDVIERLASTTQFAKVSNLEFKESAELLTASVNSLGVPIERIADVYTYLGDATATGSDELAIAMSKVAGTTSVAQISLEKMSSWLSLISSKTRESAETVGFSMQSILSRYMSIKETGFNSEDATKLNDVVRSLASIGIQATDSEGQLKNFTEIMDLLGSKFNTLTTNQKAYITTTLAGTRQGSRLSTLLQNYSESMDLYNESLNATGTTTQKFNIYQQSMQAHMDKLSNTQQNIFKKIFNSDDLIQAIDLLNSLASGVDNVFTTFGFLPTAVGVAAGAISSFKKELSLIQATKGDMGFEFTGRLPQMFNNLKQSVSSFSKEWDRLNTQSMYVNGTFAQIPSTLTRASNGFKALRTSVLSSATAFSALNLAMNIGIGLAIGAAVTGIMKLSDKLIHAKEKAKELNQELTQSVQDSAKSITEVNSLLTKAESLESQINNSKSTEEQTKLKAELLNIQKQIAQAMGSTISGFDSEGNAIAANNDLTREQIELKKQEMLLKAQEFMDKNDTDNVEARIQKYKTLQEEVKKLQLAQAQGKDKITEIYTKFDDMTGQEEEYTKTIKVNEALQDKNKEMQDIVKVVQQYNVNAETLNKFGDQEVKTLALQTSEIKKNTNARQESTQATNNEISAKQSLINLQVSLIKTLNESKDSIKEINTTLSEHAETGEWDYDTILKLAESYPDLLSKMDDSAELEKRLIEIKNAKIKATKTELDTQIDSIKKTISNYGIDVNKYQTAEEMKTAILKKQSQDRNRIRLEEMANASISSLMDKGYTKQEASARSAGAQLELELRNEEISKNVDSLFSLNEISREFDTALNNVTKSTSKSTSATKENTAAVNRSKNAIRDYENALKSLDNTIYKLEADMSGMDDSSQTYRNALSQEIKLLEQKNKTLTAGISLAKNNASALGKVPKTTNTTTNVSSSKGGVTASQLDNALGGVLKGHGADYIKYAQQYGVDPALAAAISISETGHGTSYAARVQNNPGGIMDWNNNWKTVKQFSSLEEGIKYQVKNLYDTYISKGLTSISAIGNKYAPIGAANDPNNLNKNWIPTVTEYYNKITGGTYTGSSGSATSQNNVETEIDSLISKIEDYEKQKIDIGKKIEELKIAILESDTKFYDNQIANIDSKLNTSQTNADLYSDGSQQKTQYLTEQSKLINEGYAVIAKKEQALESAIKSGGYSEKVIADLKVQLADVKNEGLSTIKELHDAFSNMWDSELMSKTKIYDDNISTLQSKIDKLNVSDKDNYEKKIKLNQKIIEQEELKKQKIEEQIKKFREMLLVEKYDSTKDLLSAKINELLKQVDEVVQAQNDAKNNAVEMAQSAMDLISTVESKIAEMIKKDVDKQKESYDKDLDNFRSAIEEKKNLINNQYDEDNYNRQLADENQKKLDIQSKINTLSLDSSDEAKAQVIELRKQLAEQQRVIDDKVAQHSKDAQIKALDDKLNAQEKAVSDAKEKLDEQYSDEEINMMARQALVDGYYTNIDGHIEKLKTAYINFENEFGEGMTSMGEIIETEFIEKIQKAIDLIGQTPELSNIIKGSSSNNSSNGNTSSKVIYGSGADLQNAKTYLSGYGYEFVDVSDGGKYKAGKNDIIVGGSAVTKNVSSNGATRLAGNNRDLTKEEIINLAKKLEKEGNSYKNGGIINNDQIALLHGSNANSSFEAVLNEPQLVNLTKSTILDTLKNVKLPSVLDNINLSQIKLPNLSSTNNASNITLKFDKLINVEGNMDKGTVIDTQKIVNEVCTKLKTVINTNGGKRVLV